MICIKLDQKIKKTKAVKIVPLGFFKVFKHLENLGFSERVSSTSVGSYFSLTRTIS